MKRDVTGSRPNRIPEAEINLALVILGPLVVIVVAAIAAALLDGFEPFASAPPPREVQSRRAGTGSEAGDE